ncbi:MAG: hypothetical protein FJ144_09915, partial [Deltaproteobacteria bacterium]|nr:hypothetical protein [Deltaproteobacteria bacterium]
MWVQVPPLAVALLAAITLACSPRFESTVALGPPDGVIARATGPAASVAVGPTGALIAFAAGERSTVDGGTDGERGDRMWIARWTSRGPVTGEPYGPTTAERPGAPLALAGG